MYVYIETITPLSQSVSAPKIFFFIFMRETNFSTLAPTF